MFTGFSSLVLVVFTLVSEKCYAGHDWNYSNQAYWPEPCPTGQMQSPIDLNVATSMFRNFSKFVFEGYAQTTRAVIKNNGHSAQITLQGVTPPRMSGGGLPDNKLYELDHVHFHWASEHTINNHRFPLELHMVHYAKESRSLAEALKTPQNVAVLGIFFEISPDDDDDFEPLMEILGVLIRDSVGQVETLSHFNTKNFMPRDRAGFFRYEGSLTTPNCTEGIVWTVFTNTLRISTRQVKQFEQLKSGDNEPLTFNYRKIQPTNGRAVFLRESPIGRFSKSGASERNLSVVLVLALIVLIAGNL